jgi:hypothetical protein
MEEKTQAKEERETEKELMTSRRHRDVTLKEVEKP